MEKKGILVVSFGTSHLDTMAKTIQVMEEQIAEAFPGYTVYRAFTSQMILNKLERTEHKKYDNVRQALERMKQDGITRVIVQPTHIINGKYTKAELADMSDMDIKLANIGSNVFIAVDASLLDAMEDVTIAVNI